MTTLPTPRYALGDIVYYPTIDQTTESFPCPDCHDTREWTATSPAGETHTIACPRCTDQYARSGRDQLPSLKIARYVPLTRRLTIGSITVKTHPYSGDDHVEYMANETGVGSGSIYRERQLYATEDHAFMAANAQAAAENEKINATPEVTRARHFSGLTYTTAALIALKDGIFNSWRAFRALSYAIESHLPEDPANDTEEQAEIREDIERYGKYGGTYLPIERHPIDALIEACRLDVIDEDALLAAIANLKTLAGFPDRAENPPCTCRHIGRYSREPTCLRHGKDATV